MFVALSRGVVLTLCFALLTSCGGRTSLFEGAAGAPVVTCSDDVIDVRVGQDVSVGASATDDGAVLLSAWTLRERPEGSEAVNEYFSPTSTTMTPDVEGDYLLEFVAVDDDGLTASCNVVVHASGPSSPPSVSCPEPMTTTPLSEVTLEASVEDDGVIVEYEWTLERSPRGSGSPPLSQPDQPTTGFAPDVVGHYVLRLRVVDDDGLDATCDASVTAQPTSGLRIELYWNPPDRSCDTYDGPDCDGSDLDLHLLHPDAPAWFDLPLDCYYATCRGEPAAWTPEGPDDDPLLPLDDVEGFGPENINIEAPMEGFVYEVGVHYFASDRPRLIAEAHVNIYCGASDMDPVYSSGPVELMPPTEEDRDFWRVASVVFQEEDECEVSPHVHVDGTPDIIRDSEARESR